MSAYTADDERAIRVGRLVQDWTQSKILTEEQRETLAPELRVDLRRTNRFLRITLFLFGLLILQSLSGLLALAFFASETTAALLCAVAAVAAFKLADLLVDRYRLYRFGVEEAVAVVSILFAAAAAALLVTRIGGLRDAPVMAAMAAGAGMALLVFRRFGYVYAAVAAMTLAALLPFVPGDSDMLHRSASATVLAIVFVVVRARRRAHGHEFPGDTYAVLEAAAFAGLYLVLNLKVSSWLSSPEEDTAFYWITYGATWLLPAIGLWLAIRDRQRALLDVSAVLALATLLTHKPYLGVPPQPWDPVGLGVLLIGVALGLRRWLKSGPDGSRRGFIAERLLESEKERIGFVATVSVVHAGPAAPPARPAQDGIGGGGRSGGAGATGSF